MVTATVPVQELKLMSNNIRDESMNATPFFHRSTTKSMSKRRIVRVGTSRPKPGLQGWRHLLENGDARKKNEPTAHSSSSEEEELELELELDCLALVTSFGD